MSGDLTDTPYFDNGGDLPRGDHHVPRRLRDDDCILDPDLRCLRRGRGHQCGWRP